MHACLLLHPLTHPCMRSMTRMAMSQSVEPRDRRLVKDSWPGVGACIRGGREGGRGGCRGVRQRLHKAMQSNAWHTAQAGRHGITGIPHRQAGIKGRHNRQAGAYVVPGVSMMRRPGSFTSSSNDSCACGFGGEGGGELGGCGGGGGL